MIRRPSGRIQKIVSKRIKSIPFVKNRLDNKYDELINELEPVLKPYRNVFSTFVKIPEKGRSRDEIISEMTEMQMKEEQRWKEGFVSGAVYHGQKGHINFLNEVYALNSQSNPLHADLFPSVTKFEAEVVSMTADMMNGSVENDEICGTITSGGTESILLAMKTYRDRARDIRNITRPEVVVPDTIHAAFDKAASYFNIRLIRVPVGRNFKADVRAMARRISKNTIALAGSAPSFPHGVIDPIEDLSELARRHDIGFHTDACLGGFILPWAEKLGYDIEPFDFRLAGVTSLSADTHKYGYAAKGTSVILYRGDSLRHYQYYTNEDWPGGLYFSPTFAGSRPGALSAACWAAMTSMGEEGYLDSTKRILETGAAILDGIGGIPELEIMGDPLWVIALQSDTVNIYRVLDFMTGRSWNLNGLHHPPAMHLALTLPHTQPGVVEKFLKDLKDAVEYVKTHPDDKGAMAPIYGMAATMPIRGIVSDILKRYMDLLYRV